MTRYFSFYTISDAGMVKYGLKAKDIVSYVKIISNSTIGLIDRQNVAYAYIPIN